MAQNRKYLGNASVARDAAQTELGEHRRPGIELPMLG